MRSGQERTIFHVDVNSAFLSWSAVKRLREDPEAVDLRTIPSAVGGDEATRHGIITAKSIPAIIHTGKVLPAVNLPSAKQCRQKINWLRGWGSNPQPTG